MSKPSSRNSKKHENSVGQAWDLTLRAHLTQPQTTWGGKAALQISPLLIAVSYCRLSKKKNNRNWFKFWVSAEMETPQLLWETCSSENIYSHEEFPVFQFVLIASCPAIGHHWEVRGAVFLILLPNIYKHVLSSRLQEMPSHSIPGSKSISPDIQSGPTMASASSLMICGYISSTPRGGKAQRCILGSAPDSW